MNQNYGYGYNNGYGGNYGSGYGAPAPAPTYNPQPATNKIYVTSAEDAMQRFANPNSVMVYVLQDESAIFEVYTDAQGRKTVKAKKLVDYTAEADRGGYVTRAEFEELKGRLEALGKGEVQG